MRCSANLFGRVEFVGGRQGKSAKLFVLGGPHS